jgi:hypothetical protein
MNYYCTRQGSIEISSEDVSVCRARKCEGEQGTLSCLYSSK